MTTEEQVLCVPTSILESCGMFQGYAPFTPALEPIFARENQVFLPRAVVEEDPTYKQLIPYIVIAKNGSLLHYQRSKLKGEQRLAGKRSLGFGGHINPCDLSARTLGYILDRPEFLSDAYVNGMLRELHEELNFGTPPVEWNITIRGFVNDDSNAVGQVHLGVVHVLYVHEGVNPAAREENIQDITWNRGAEILNPRIFDQLENWSKIIAPHHAEWRPARRQKVDI